MSLIMKKIILLLFLIPIGCSTDGSAPKDSPSVADLSVEESTVTSHIPIKIEHDIISNCTTEPLLKMFEDFVELGVKSANLTTEKASVSFSKLKTSEIKIKNKLMSEYGSDFLKDACAYDGLVFSMRDVYEGYLGAYQITFLSKEKADLAVSFLENLDRENFQTNKVATVFNWKRSGATILIIYNDPAITKYYDHNVRELSK